MSCQFNSVLRRENICLESDAASSGTARKWEASASLTAFVPSFLASFYIAMWATRPVFRFFRSATSLI